MDSDAKAEIAAQLLAFAEQTKDFVGVADPWGRILYLNLAARKRLGLGDEAVELTTADIFPAEAFALYYDVVRPELLRSGAWSGELPVNDTGMGSVMMRVSISTRLGPGGEINESVMYGHEVGRNEVAGFSDEDHLDDMTGLLLRSAFEERARLVLADAARSGEACVLVLATISDAVGEHETFHALTAETVMRALAGRLKRFARTTDVVGRFGESQLCVLLRGVRTHSDALRIGRTVHEFLVHPPVTTPGEEIAPSVGCGIGFAAGADLLDLIAAASAIRWLEPATAETASVAAPLGDDRADLATMDEFRIGMSNGEVRSYAQPVVDLTSELVIGYQGFARWHHRWLGPLDAAAFVGMIAETALATQVDLYVIRETAAVLTLRTRGVPLSLYAPVSRRLVADARTEQYLSEIVDAFSLAMDQVRLQLAPSLVPEPQSALMDALLSLRDAQVALVVTDVDLAVDAERFAELGFGELQLSRRLTRSAAIEREARHTVDEIVRIARDRGVMVTATGVDEPEQRAAVREAGCDRAIGALFGQPEPASTID